jgi:hypothetical protein
MPTAWDNTNNYWSQTHVFYDIHATRQPCSSRMQANWRQQDCSEDPPGHGVQVLLSGNKTERLRCCCCRFMKQQCMLSELQGLLCELQADRHSDQGHQEGTGTSHGTDAPSAAAVASLTQHLQAASLAQQLALPDTAAQINPFGTLHQPKDSSCSSSGTCHMHRPGAPSGT